MAMTTNVQSQVLDQVLLIQLEPHIWSGRKKLQTEDLHNVQSADLPPATLASLGSKKIVDTDKLKVFENLKKRAQRACENSGVRFLGGYAVPLTKVTEVAKELDAVEAEFEKEKVTFLAHYQTYVGDWMKSHPSWAHLISSAITPLGYVEAALGFSWQAIQVKEPKGKAGKIVNRGLQKQVSGLSDQLLKEIAISAEDMLIKALQGKDKVTQKALNRVRLLREKLHDLSFLNSGAHPLAQSIDYTLTLMPSVGIIEGIAFDALYALVSLLSSPDRASAHGQAILNGKPVADAMNELVMGAQPSMASANVFAQPQRSVQTSLLPASQPVAATAAPVQATQLVATLPETPAVAQPAAEAASPAIEQTAVFEATPIKDADIHDGSIAQTSAHQVKATTQTVESPVVAEVSKTGVTEEIAEQDISELCLF
jgi:hypothetical protein